jgi:hypothetical protein
MKFSEDFHKIKPKVEQQLFLIKTNPFNQLCYHSIPSGNFGIKTGYNWYPSLENSKSYFMGNAFAL